MKRIIIKYLSVFLIILIAVVGLGGTQQMWASEQTGQTGVSRLVRVGYYITPGFQEYDEESKTYSGYSYEYLLALAQYANWEYEFVPVSFSEGVEMLKNGELDLMNNVSQTEERMEYLSYSSLSSGSNCAYLAVSSDDTSVAYEDYPMFNSLTVGLVTTSIYSERFLNFCKENDFMPNIVYFDTKEEAVAALEAGTVDARVITSSQNIDMHIIAKFAPEEFYFAVPKAQKELLRELNQAMGRLKANDLDFEVRLEKKYYSNVVDENTVLTEKEKTFIKENPVIRVAYDKDCYPLSYTDSDGNFAGTIAEIYRLISQRIGLEFSFEAVKAASLSAAVASGEAYLYAELPYDYIWASDYKVRLTPPFTDITVLEARNMKFSGTSGRVAVVKGYYLGKLCQDVYGDSYTYLEYENTKECLEAVRKGEADLTCLTSYEGETYQSRSNYRSLSFSVSQKLNYSLSIGVSHMADPSLFSIMMKGLNAVSADEIDVLFRETTVAAQKTDTWTVILDHPEIVFPVILVVAFLLAGVAFMLFHIRVIRRKNRIIEIKNTQLADAVAQADRASVAKGQFLSRISHEIRTPMNAIVGLTGIAQSHRQDPEKTGECLKKIEVSSKVLLNILNDVLDMSAIESNKLKITKEAFDIRETLCSITTIYSPQCEGKGILLETELDVKTPNVLGDSLRVNQILLNLVSNAFKFTERGGKIRILLTETAKKDRIVFFRFTVSDTGCGMSEELQKRLFRPFEQESANTARKYGGSGLGLSIAKNLVDIMHGAISVQSEKGRGTEFLVDLPFEQAEEVVSRVSPVQKEDYDFSGSRILLAEDNDMNAEIAKELLGMVHLELVRVADGQKAVDEFLQKKPGTYQAVLMDVQMPVMDGYEAARMIRASDHSDAKTIPIFAMTANAFTEDIAASLSAGMNGHIAKPIDTGMLYRTLAGVLKQKK